ncbi:MAG: hypothetical protein BGO39_03810 [Chloroflexi bacterium 54-19]|nr:MAG: hypothetical protein BGO39_03810 [Chloroflexi bacterium 54-19]
MGIKGSIVEWPIKGTKQRLMLLRVKVKFAKLAFKPLAGRGYLLLFCYNKHKRRGKKQEEG